MADRRPQSDDAAGNGAAVVAAQTHGWNPGFVLATQFFQGGHAIVGRVGPALLEPSQSIGQPGIAAVVQIVSRHDMNARKQGADVKFVR
jgi:hypothetical protein